MAKRELLPCGTAGAFARHRAHGEEPCDPCREANRAYMRANEAKHRARQREAKGLPPTVPLKPCGTMAAYRRHLRRGEKPCDPCREAKNAYYRKGGAKRTRTPPLEPWQKEAADRAIANMNRKGT